jgi:hypothetical protein
VLGLAVTLLGVRGAFRLRDRALATRGCPACGGPLARKNAVFGCRPCRMLWIPSGFELVLLKEVPVDLLPLPDEVPRAQLRQRDDD